MEKVLNRARFQLIARRLRTTGIKFLDIRRSLIFLSTTQTHRHQGKGENMSTNNGNKNAYEIRLEVLQMAVGMIDASYYAQLDKVRHIAKDQPYELPEDTRVRDALRTAKKLYAFVEGDGNAE